MKNNFSFHNGSQDDVCSSGSETFNHRGSVFQVHLIESDEISSYLPHTWFTSLSRKHFLNDKRDKMAVQY